MKILLCSYVFAPSVGGIEAVSRMLAEQLTCLGHEVTVVTQTPAEEAERFRYRVVRRPEPKEFLKWMRWADVCFHNNISLQMIWPLPLLRKPWVVTHQTWIGQEGRPYTRQEKIKRFALRFAHNISISTAIAAHLPVPSVIIGNPYQDELFRELPNIARDRELVFLGRLVSDKGMDVLLRALEMLAQTGMKPHLTVIGQGPEETSLRQLATTLGLASQVQFVGPKRGEELVRLLNTHQILVAPSRWKEPFGLVALEGIACGCVVVGSRDGGLIDAIGPCGTTFPNGDVLALAGELTALLSDGAYTRSFRACAGMHLKKFRAEAVAQAYLRVFDAAIGGER